MRIICVSEKGLPDWRIEKSALTGIKNGHVVFFVGNAVSPNYQNSIFSGIYNIYWTPKAMMGLPFYWHKLRKRFSQIIKEVRPDIIHAHNIFSAKLASEFDIPLVYDDHEYWSKQVRLVTEDRGKLKPEHRSRNAIRKYAREYALLLSNIHIIRTWTKWEREIVSKYPTIAVDKSIADDLISRYSCKVFVVPNYPIQDEILDIPKPKFHDKLSCIYAGVDNKLSYPSYRDLSQLPSIFLNNNIGTLTITGWEPEASEKVIAVGFLPRNQMYEMMAENSIGLIPWRKHWSHWYLSPNKAYEYAHAGLVVYCISSLRAVIRNLGEYCVTFEEMHDLANNLTSVSNDMDALYKKRLQIFDYARKNFLWENHEKNILEAYKVC